MAPKRGGGGDGGGGGISINTSCPGAFAGDDSGILSTPIPYFIAYCLFFLVTLFILIGWFRVKKRHPDARKLVGPLYGLSLLFTLVGYALAIVGTMLRECHTTDYWTYYDWAIAWTVFFRLSTFFLLVVVLWGVNDVLRAKHGDHPAYLKLIYGVVLGFVAVLSAAYLGIQCYNLWTNTEDGYHADPLLYEQERLAVAYWVFYLLAVVMAGAVSIASIISARLSTSNLLGWTIALTLSMSIWVLFTIIEAGSSLQNNYLGLDVYEACEFIVDGFQSIAYIILLFLAKSAAFQARLDNTDPHVYNQQPTYAPNQLPIYAPLPVPQHQYAYHNGNGNGTQPPYAYNNNNNANDPQQQQYYYQQSPFYNASPSPANGQAHMAQPK